jgi:hypothetical protein
MTASLDERRREFGEMLGLDGPVTESVLAAALQDERYAYNLLTCRRTPALLDQLLANPPVVERRSTLDLLRSASGAFLRWGRTGFTTVDEEVYRRRLERCAACPHLTEPANHRVLYAAIARDDGRRVCGLCGCAVAKKARLSSERCPGTDPHNERLTRWGEPREGGAHGL